MGNRKKTEEFILKYISKIAGADNKKLYEDLFKSMNNKEFDNFIELLKNNKTKLSIIAPNGMVKLDVEKNFKIAKELGYDFFQRVRVGKGKDGYITTNKYFIANIPVRRASQLLTKKISLPKSDRVIDLTTGQVTGESEGSKLTTPEIQLLTSLGLKASVIELMKSRGGDLGEKNAMISMLTKQGIVSQNVLEAYSTGVISTKTLKAYFQAMHIKNNL